jgi:RHS repeat-associated protein
MPPAAPTLRVSAWHTIVLATQPRSRRQTVSGLRRYDDFGRKVAEGDPDHGLTIFRHDAAGHVVARVDEALAVSRYVYDHAGRLLSMGMGDRPNLVQYRYQGRQLSSMVSTPDGKPEHATERVDYECDGFGRVLKETRWLANVAQQPGAPSGFRFVTVSRYDDAGRLVNQVLPDGHRIAYRYIPADAEGTKGRRPGQLEAILFDDEPVVTDIEQTAAGGLTGYTMGNGALQQVSLDGRGRVEQLQVLASTDNTGWWGRIKSWFSSKEVSSALLYGQINRYDADGRLTHIERRSQSADARQAGLVRNEVYAYDQMNRLTAMRSADGTDTRFAYDKGGNRIEETVEATREDAAGAIAARQTYHYAYAPGSNRLLATTASALNETVGAPRNAAEGAQWIRNAWLYHATGVPLARLGWADSGTGSNRRIVYNTAKRPLAVYVDGHLLAQYHYNVQGERVAKTVYAAQPALTPVSASPSHRSGITTYFLYREQRLAADANSAGQLTTHYLYLYGKPIAKIELLPAQSWLYRLWKAAALHLGSERSDTSGHIYAIVGDHLGTPELVLDENQKVVWQADTNPFGKARVRFAALRPETGHAFIMNLRLPGQVYDAETGLNQNYYRDYDPSLGRYTTADPMGLAGGMNPYEYVGSNPLTKIDPLGLYQSDVHYYMTYFLGITAGMGAADARMMALATQYIDDNPDTQPVDEKNLATIMLSPLWNQNNLAKYHFVLWTQQEDKAPVFSTDKGTADPLGKSPQLRAMLGYATEYAPENCAPNKTSLQFMGQFLHAFEDTYAHRHPDNTPFPVNFGFGHGAYGSHPDYTYNHENGRLGLPALINKEKWVNNESRTLEMEHRVYDQIVDYMKVRNYEQFPDHMGKRVSNEQLQIWEKALNSFNACQANEQSDKDNSTTCADERAKDGELSGLSAKIAILNNALGELGYSETLVWSKDKNAEGGVGYNEDKAAGNRVENLKDLDQKKYCNTNLPGAKPCKDGDS